MRKPRMMLASAWIGLLLSTPAAQAADEGGDTAIRESVVKVFATMRAPDPFRPWTKQSPRDGSGTGVVIEGKRILTNAHVVSYASQVFVQPYQSGQKIAATVESFASGIDLAVLKLDDESFFDGHPPLKRVAELPQIKDSVIVYGYPAGGDTQSVTKGIVSRIEFTGYGQQTWGLRIQVDAAINPGNSGGPALVEDKLIGIVFQKLGSADNIGYIIPTEEVELFLKDVADGKYDGKPMLYDQLQTLENDALKARLELPKGAEGMVVHEPDTAADSPLKKWDVITKVGESSIDNVGMSKVRDNLRLAFQYQIQRQAKEGKVRLTVLREGKELGLDLAVRTHKPMLIEGLQGRYPPYFIYGPLVFSLGTSEFVGLFERQGGAFAALAAIGNPLVTRRGDSPRFPGEELVIVTSPLFPHKVSKGYGNPVTKVVKEVDGVPIKGLRHLVETLRDGKGRFVTITFDDHGSETIVFDRREVVAATEEILTDNGVRRQSSDDLLGVWEKR